MAAAWHGGYADADTALVQDENLRLAISSAMNYWFQNDFKDPNCLDAGGAANSSKGEI